MGDGDGYPQPSSAASRTVLIWDCPLLPGTRGDDSPGARDLPPLTPRALSLRFLLEKASHPSPAQASAPLAQQLPPHQRQPCLPPIVPAGGTRGPSPAGNTATELPRGFPASLLFIFPLQRASKIASYKKNVCSRKIKN